MRALLRPLWTLLVSLLCLVPASAQEFTAVQATDLHWGNPAFDPVQWDKAWQRIAQFNPDMLVLTGDHADNRGGVSDFFRRKHEFLEDLQQRLKGGRLTVALTLGNNDLYPNYSTDPETLERVLRAYRHYLGARFYLDELGNGRLPAAPAGTVWLSLNSQLFSPKNRYSGAEAQAEQAMEWLEQELSKVEPGSTVYLLSHIAPVVDLWDGELSWRPEWVERIRSVLSRSESRVVILSGHFHRNELLSIELGPDRVSPVFVAAAMSRKYEYYASWRLYRFEGGEVEYAIEYPELGWRTEPIRLAQMFRSAPFARLRDSLSQSQEAYEEYAREVFAWNPYWKDWASDKGKRKMLLDLILGGGLEGPVRESP